MTDRIIMPLDAWPVQDRTLWSELLRPGSPFEDPGPMAHLRASTVGMYESAYGRWLGWIARTHPEALTLDPILRASFVRFEAWVSHNERLSPTSRCLVAKKCLGVLSRAVTEPDFAPHWRLVRRLQHQASEHVSDRKTGRVLDSAELLSKSLAYAGSAESVRQSVRQHTRRRDGCLLAFLTLVPLRRRALSALQLGRSVLVSDSEIRIIVDPDMNKTGRVWETVLPKQLDPVFRTYLEQTRPALLARANIQHSYLWVTREGMPLPARSLSSQVRRISLAIFGKEISPHLFRDAAATSLARVSSADARMIVPLLGHTDLRTSEKHYNHAGALEVARDYATLIESFKSRR